MSNFRHDDLVETKIKDEIRVGLVVSTSDDDSIALQPGQCRVAILSDSEPSRIVNDQHLKLLDRPLMCGDVVSRNTRLGTVVNTRQRLTLTSVNEKEYDDVDSSQVSGFHKFQEGSHVLDQSMIHFGVVEETFDMVSVMFADGSVAVVHEPPDLVPLELHHPESILSSDRLWPGCQVRGEESQWRNASWVKGSYNPEQKTGIVIDVSPHACRVKWIAHRNFVDNCPNQPVPSDIIDPKSLIKLPSSLDSVTFQLGDKVQYSQEPTSQVNSCCTIVSTLTLVDVFWEDGELEQDISTTDLDLALVDEDHVWPLDWVYPVKGGDLGMVKSVDPNGRQCMVQWPTKEKMEGVYDVYPVKEWRYRLGHRVVILEPNQPFWIGEVVDVVKQLEIKMVSVLGPDGESRQYHPWELLALEEPTYPAEYELQDLVEDLIISRSTSPGPALSDDTSQPTEIWESEEEEVEVVMSSPPLLVEPGSPPNPDLKSHMYLSDNQLVSLKPGDYLKVEIVPNEETDSLDAKLPEAVSLAEESEQPWDLESDLSLSHSKKYSWLALGKHFPRFAVLDETPHNHVFAKSTSPGSIKRLQREFNILQQDLPQSILVRTFSSRMDLLSVILVGPSETPYEGALFLFDVHIPSLYPAIPPRIHFKCPWDVTKWGRLAPSIFEDNTVCLPLFSSWNPRWNLCQVLVALHALVLGEERGTIRDKMPDSKTERYLLLSNRCLLYALKNKPFPFEKEINGYFYAPLNNLERFQERWKLILDGNDSDEVGVVHRVSPEAQPLLQTQLNSLME